LGEKPHLTALKKRETEKALKYGAVDILLLSKSLDKHTIKHLKEMAKATGAKIEIISTDTEEGIQFKNLGGVGAILRFEV